MASLDLVRPVAVFHDQFAAFVFVGVAEENSGGDIAADAPCPAHARIALERAIDVVAIGAATRVAVEQGRDHAVGQRSRDEHRVRLQRLGHLFTQVQSQGCAGLQLLIGLDLHGLRTRGGAAIRPGPLARIMQGLTDGLHLLGAEHLWDMQQHDGLPSILREPEKSKGPAPPEGSAGPSLEVCASAAHTPLLEIRTSRWRSATRCAGHPGCSGHRCCSASRCGPCRTGCTH
jgi:hypothetical protein